MGNEVLRKSGSRHDGGGAGSERGDRKQRRQGPQGHRGGAWTAVPPTLSSTPHPPPPVDPPTGRPIVWRQAALLPPPSHPPPPLLRPSKTGVASGAPSARRLGQRPCRLRSLPPPALPAARPAPLPRPMVRRALGGARAYAAPASAVPMPRQQVAEAPGCAAGTTLGGPGPALQQRRCWA